MTIIAMPASVRIRRVRWQLDRPAQVNRSAYSGARRVVANPWHGKWSASAELAPIVGEANVRSWRAFLASLKGQINTFQLPATEGPQYAGSNPTAGASAAQGATTIQLTATYDFTGLSNLITDPGFDNGAYWTLVGGPTISGSKGNFTAGGWIYKAGLLPSAGAYQVTYDLVTRTAGTVRPFVGTTNVFGTYQSGVATYTEVIVGTTSGDAGLNSGTSFAGTVDNLIIKGPGVSSAPALKAGMLVTVTLPSGNKQLVLLTADIDGSNNITFEPPLREAISSGAAIEAIRPFAVVALADSSFGWSVDPGTLYGISFNADEAF